MEEVISFTANITAAHPFASFSELKIDVSAIARNPLPLSWLQFPNA